MIKAQADGTRIIPCCGFDSAPSDLGAMLIAHALGPDTRELKSFFQIKGGFNGGTIASMMNMYETGADKTMSDPFLLSPSVTRAPRNLEQDPAKAAYDTDANVWTAPFMMSKINTRVVRRSCAISGSDFAYQEYTKLSGHAMASVLATTGDLFDPFDALPRSAQARPRNLARARRGRPSTMNTGWFRCELFSKTSNGLRKPP